MKQFHQSLHNFIPVPPPSPRLEHGHNWPVNLVEKNSKMLKHGRILSKPGRPVLKNMEFEPDTGFFSLSG